MSRLKTLFNILRDTYQEWNEDKVPRLAAALSYYTIFSIAPLLIVIVAIIGFFFGQEAAQGQLDNQIQGLVGREGADLIQSLVANTNRPADNTIASIVGIATLLLGAGGVFGQLQDALNTVWGVEPKAGRGILGIIKDRFLSFTMVLGVGFLLLVSLVISAVLSGVGDVVFSYLPGNAMLVELLNNVISFVVITLLFAMIYKILPDVDISWKDVGVGAAVTAFLFIIGKFLIGLYLGNSSTASAYGAAASLVVLLLWIFYSSQILLFGAEFTQVYARKYGSEIRPDSDAVAITNDARAEQGISASATGKAVTTKTPVPNPIPLTNAPAIPAVIANDLTPEKQLPVALPTATAVLGFVGGYLLARKQPTRTVHAATTETDE